MTRFLDILFSFLALVILLPFLLPVCLVLLLTGEHHVLYFQSRVGRGGRDFAVWKFATMLKNSPQLPGGILTQNVDPRVLPVGRFLRKTKINELPQLVNILIGQMSFVGPRPQVRQHYELYAETVKSEIDRLLPGLTGVGSVVFRDEEAILDRVGGDRDLFHDTVITPYKGELEVWYTRHHSLLVYCALIILTAWTILRPGSKAHRKMLPDLPEPPAELSMLR